MLFNILKLCVFHLIFSPAMVEDRNVTTTIDTIGNKLIKLMHYIQFSIVHVDNKLTTLFILIRLWTYFGFYEVTIICKTIKKITHIVTY